MTEEGKVKRIQVRKIQSSNLAVILFYEIMNTKNSEVFHKVELLFLT